MKKFLSTLFFGTALFLSVSNPSFSTDFSKNYSDAVDSVVEIVGTVEENKNSSQVYATGFFFEDRFIITANHTLWMGGVPKNLMVCGNEIPSICADKVKVVYQDTKHDIAILEVLDEDWENLVKYEHVKSSSITHELITAGEEIYGIGNRFGFLFHSYYGHISMPYVLDHEDGGIHYIDAELFKGDSGGPVFNTNNEVVGIAKEYLIPDKDSEHLEAITTNIQLLKAIKDWKKIGKSFNILDGERVLWDYNHDIQLTLTSKLNTPFLDQFGIEKGDYDFYVTILGVNTIHLQKPEDMKIILEQISVGDSVTIEWTRDDKKISKTIIVKP